MSLLWATRGRTWGFRFLRSGGAEDPLLAYDELFDAVDGQQPEVFHRLGDRVALRFPDPERRTDAAGRIIPHEFVLSGAEADGVTSLAEGRARIWPLVAAEYAQVWGTAEPPAGRE